MIRPLNPKVKTILKVAISLAVVAFVLLLWANPRPVPIQVRVTFTGFTNLATPFHITQASFCVSNAGRCSVFDEGLQRIEIKNTSFDGLFGLPSLGVASELKPGEFKTISLEPPTEFQLQLNPLRTQLEPWRLSLSFSKADWREKLVRNSPSVLQKVLRFVPPKWLERQPIEVHSDWISGPELMSVATNTANTATK